MDLHKWLPNFADISWNFRNRINYSLLNIIEYKFNRFDRRGVWQVEQCDGLSKLEALQDDQNEGIYARAVRQARRRGSFSGSK